MTYWLTRFYFQRALGFIYTIGFIIILNQFKGLCGEKGILPMRLFLNRITFWDSPTLFWFNSSDHFVLWLGSIGLVLSVAAVTGLSDSYGSVVSSLVWFSLWLIYLSFVNAGQTFYGFGWESLLLETGFLAIFLGAKNSPPSVILIWLLRWILFRLMFGAGLIKIRGDECWRDLTCMQYHYETQPMPNPLSWFFHQGPQFLLKGEVLFTHFVELIVPFFYFGPRYFRHTAGIITIIFQGILILSGNLSWLNYLTIVLAIACFDDSFFPKLSAWTQFPGTEKVLELSGGWPQPVIYLFATMVALLSVKPTVNLFSRRQIMNTSFEPLHLVNTYGAFGSITKTRYEVMLEGSDDQIHWKEYLFKGKPCEVTRLPPIVSPYHLRLDWQMWFAAMSSYEDHPWILSLVGKLLQGNKDVAALLRENPFGDKPPKYIRALTYEYHFSKPGDKTWWTRTLVGEYLPSLSLDNLNFRNILESQGWLDSHE